MHSLRLVQERMRDALHAEQDRPLDDLLGATAPRFEIHRHNFVRSLTRALEKTYPAVVSLVDARFFAYAADRFIRAHPPAAPCLFDYGGELGGFLDGFAPCAPLPYLGDVARLEWEIHCAFHAADSGPGYFKPFVRHFASPWPVDAIWRVALGRAEGPVDLASGQARLVIYRAGDDVSFTSLTSAEFAFQLALREHGDPVKAARASRAADQSFDPAAALGRLEFNGQLLVQVPAGRRQ